MKKQTETERVLLRLKAWLGKQRARFERLRADESASPMSRERAFGEASVCGLTMSQIDKLLREHRGRE